MAETKLGSRSTVQSSGVIQRRKKRPWPAIIEFLAPAILLYLGFKVIPFFITFFNSVHTLRMDLGMKTEFVGLKNFVILFTNDPTFLMAMLHSATWALISPVLEISIAFILAYIVFQKVPLARLYRVAWFMPVLISWVVVGAIFRWIYNYEWGVINVVFRALGLNILAQNWLGNTEMALPSLIAVTTWKFTGFNFIILLAAMSSIPQTLFDAARVDGVSVLQLIRNVIIPLVRPTIANLIILCFVGKMKVFDLVWIMTRGGPVGSTETVGTYIQKRAFEWNTLDLGYPSAMAVVWLLVIFTCWIVLSQIMHTRSTLEY